MKEQEYMIRNPLQSLDIEAINENSNLRCIIPVAEEGKVKKVAALNNDIAEQLLGEIDMCVKKHTKLKYSLRIVFDENEFINFQDN